MEERIGTLNEDGSVNTWPEKTVRGGRYSHPATTMRLDNKHFVVIDGDSDESLFIEEIKETLKPKAAKKAKQDENSG